ncbi:MAG: metallophosphoesterase [Planctomycetota bacterium]
MSQESFRFIHASDFHLESPLGDLDSLPPNLRDAIATAPRDAVMAIFEAAAADNIDFLVLSGDLLHPVTAGPHGMAILLDGFERLHSKATPVYWVHGLADDPKQWPEAVPLPPNVTLFPKDRAVTVTYERAGRAICQIVGRSSEGRSLLNVAGFQFDDSDMFTIGLGYGTADVAALSNARIDYWALGGPHNHASIEEGAAAGAVAPGSPQGRSMSETGSHGYTVVDIDAERTSRVHHVASDHIRYCHVTIDAEDIRAVGSLRNLLGQKINELANEAEGRHLLIAWDVTVADAELLGLVGDPGELLRQLRRDHGVANPVAWTTRLSIRPPKQYPASWFDEDTILGDFLRAAKKYRHVGDGDDSKSIDLMPFTEERSDLSSTAANLLGDVPAGIKDDVLNDATLLGVEMLRGGKPKFGAHRVNGGTRS